MLREQQQLLQYHIATMYNTELAGQPQVHTHTHTHTSMLHEQQQLLQSHIATMYNNKLADQPQVSASIEPSCCLKDRRNSALIEP